ncbi:MAG: S8 family serine peptidase, partial [Acidobacteria bacterium]|nr:S8 family serine peptidase [Acidobacteriota bacterium]
MLATALVAGALVLPDGWHPASTRSAETAVVASKLRGGLAEMLALGFQPDPRLEDLVPGFRPGEFVVYAVVDGPANRYAAEVAAAGARVRWAFRSVDAVSAVAPRDAVLALAARPWVRALYPVRSARLDDAEEVSGTITRGDPPKVHPIRVRAGSRSISIDLSVVPPTAPHFDVNPTDFIEALLVDPKGRTVQARPNSLAGISFRYGENTPLRAGTWALQIWYRSANLPTAPITFVYRGTVNVTGESVAREPAAKVQEGCAGRRHAGTWQRHPNLKRRGTTDIGAPALWADGITGRGVRVAVLDTGVDASHVDLDDQDWERWGAPACSPKVIADALFLAGRRLDGQGNIDTGGHGTHVAGELAGTAEGATDEQRGAYPGVAPEASIIAGRIALDITALSDDMLAAAEWSVIDQRADVVSLSFGIDVRYGVLTDRNDPQAAGFEALATSPAWGYPSIQVAAGNAGDLFSTIGAPATAPHVNAIAAAVKDWDLVLREGEAREDGSAKPVGAEDAKGRVHPSVAAFSSRGPSQDLFFAPDFAAPGHYIVAARSNQTSEEPNGYESFSGTSMATPHASGAAALLIDGYRRRFGTSGAFGNRPPFWLVAAAVSNTAGTPAPRPAFAGGMLRKVSYGTGADGLFLMYGGGASRESGTTLIRPVGPLVEGAGRVNIPAALAALTEGLVIYTAGDPAAPKWYELQPSIQAGTAKPGEAVRRRLVLHPAAGGRFAVRFRAARGVPSVNTGAIAPSWWRFPRSVEVNGGDAGVEAVLSVPKGTAPGIYTGYLLADVVDRQEGSRFKLRLPAMAAVEVVDFDRAAG